MRSKRYGRSCCDEPDFLQITQIEAQKVDLPLYIKKAKARSDPTDPSCSHSHNKYVFKQAFPGGEKKTLKSIYNPLFLVCVLKIEWFKILKCTAKSDRKNTQEIQIPEYVSMLMIGIMSYIYRL